MVLPLVVSVAMAWLLSGVLPKPHSFAMGIARWFAIALVSTLVLISVDKLARRLLPLATLFGLTLAFPDQAPSRFRMALRTGSTTQLRRRIADARSGAPSDTPAEAAERVLELVIALNAHDRLTRGHSERVRAYTQMIGDEMGLTDTELDRLRWSGLLHDIGKLRISGAILNKPGKLTVAEFEQIKLHPEYGRELVAPLIGWLGDSARAVWEHHERWDGRGYPYGLSGTDISLAGRIVAVADTYDVITSVRSYKKAISPAEARAELTRCAGTQFDPAVVRAFMNLSLGRLRLAMGPLSWLAQLPLFPTALTTTGAAGTTGAATALVGAAAASVGLGLAGDPIVPKDHVAFASVPATSKPFDYVEIDTGPRRRPGGRGPRAVGELTDDGTGSAGRPPQRTTSRTGVARPPIAPAITTTTTTPARTDSTTTTPRRSRRPREAVDHGAGRDAAGRDAAAGRDDRTDDDAAAGHHDHGEAVDHGAGRDAAGVTLPRDAAAGPDDRAHDRRAPRRSRRRRPRPRPRRRPRPPPRRPPRCRRVRHGCRPQMCRRRSTSMCLARSTSPPSRCCHSRAPPRPRSAWPMPTATGGRASRSQRLGNEISFGLAAPTNATIRGGASGVVYVSTAALLASTVSVRARLMVCDSNGACTVASERTGSALVTVLALLPINYNFGTIDVTVPAGGSLRVVLDVPASSSGDALLSADAALSASAITVIFR